MTDAIITVFVLATLLLDVCYSDKRCMYYDRFQRVKYRTCSTGCCGNYHRSYCCEGQNVAGIVVGSFVGAIILAIILGLIICWCKQRRTRVYRRIHVKGAVPHYGSTKIADDRPTDDSVEVIVPTVEINVTPATPELEPKQT